MKLIVPLLVVGCLVLGKSPQEETPGTPARPTIPEGFEKAWREAESALNGVMAPARELSQGVKGDPANLADVIQKLGTSLGHLRKVDPPAELKVFHFSVLPYLIAFERECPTLLAAAEKQDPAGFNRSLSYLIELTREATKVADMQLEKH
jgi:hypothetical protein